MKYFGIKPVFIFDGKTPAIKKRCVERRRKKWDDEKRMKGVLKKLVMREQTRTKVHQRIYGDEEGPAEAQRTSEEVEQEHRERSGELTFNVADAPQERVHSNASDVSSGIDDSWSTVLDVPDLDVPPHGVVQQRTTTSASGGRRFSKSPLTTNISIKSADNNRLVPLNLFDSTGQRQSPKTTTTTTSSTEGDKSDQDEDIQIVSHRQASLQTTTAKTAVSKRSSSLAPSGGFIHKFDKELDFSLLDADDLSKDAPLLLQNSDIDLDTFHQMPPNIQREIIAELERKANFKYIGGTVERTQDQGGGIDRFSGNQVDALIKSNNAHRSLKRIQELEMEKKERESVSQHNDSLPTLESSQSVWSGTNTQGETMEIVDNTPRSNAQPDNLSTMEAQSLVVDDIEEGGVSSELRGGFLPDSEDEDDEEQNAADPRDVSGGFLHESDDEDEWEEYPSGQNDPPTHNINSERIIREEDTSEMGGGFAPDSDEEEDDWESSGPISTPVTQSPTVTTATTDQFKTAAPKILSTPSNSTLKSLGLDPEVFSSLPFPMQQEILKNLEDVSDISPIVRQNVGRISATADAPPPIHNLTAEMGDDQNEEDEWEVVVADTESTQQESKARTSINLNTLTDFDKAFARELFPSEIFDPQSDLSTFRKTMNQEETDLEKGVTPIDARIKEAPLQASFNPDDDDEDPELRRLSVQSLLSNATSTPRNRSFDEENRALQAAYAKENPDYTPGKDTSVTLSSPSLQNTPDMYDVSTPNTIFNTPDYQRRVRLQSSRREGSLSVYNEFRELINQLFRLLGVPYIQSPYEADAQCGFMAEKEMIDAIISDDSDIFVFGGKRLFKFAFKKSDDKVVEEYTIDRIRKELGLSRYDLIAMAMLLGSDYTEGVHNVGPVTAIEVIEAFRPTPKKSLALEPEEYIYTILKEFSKWANILTAKKPTKIKSRKDRFKRKYHNLKKRAVFPSGFPDRTVIRAYMEPQVDTNEDPIIWGDLESGDALYTFAEQHMGLDRESVDKYLDPVRKKQRERETQLTMESFVDAKRVAKIRSERVKCAVSRLKRMKKSEEKETEEQKDEERMAIDTDFLEEGIITKKRKKSKQSSSRMKKRAKKEEDEDE